MGDRDANWRPGTARIRIARPHLNALPSQGEANDEVAGEGCLPFSMRLR
jgi:hypothetical protein